MHTIISAKCSIQVHKIRRSKQHITGVICSVQTGTSKAAVQTVSKAVVQTGTSKAAALIL